MPFIFLTWGDIRSVGAFIVAILPVPEFVNQTLISIILVAYLYTGGSSNLKELYLFSLKHWEGLE